MKAVVMPALGVAMSEGLLLGWLKATGDAVAEGEPIMEIETDKSTIEVVSPASGVVGALLFEPGALVPVGVEMTRILETGDAEAPPISASGTPTAPDGADAVPHETVPSGQASAAAPPARAAEPGERQPHRLSPRERRLAREGGDATGSGQGATGPATATELSAGADPSVTPSTAPAQTSGVPAIGRHRALIAAKVTESWRTIPHFAVTREVEAAGMATMRARHGEDRPGFTDLMIKALALALRERGETGPVDVGLAVATPQGVAIPVIRDVLALGLADLRRETAGAILRARDGRLRPADLSDPPRSTLSNLGPQGIDSFTGVIAAGQTSILTVGRILPRPAVVDGLLTVRESFIATLNVDHRVMDGDDAASLLMAFVGAVEDADRLETEVVPG